jgi:pyruvate/2-oxoglutarate dehydrogenase complex dihydrolipoamide dehydrogenase (E3) component
LGIEKGIEKGKVVTSVDVLLGKKDVGERVLIIGGGSVGCETGVYLAQQGKKRTLEPDNIILAVGLKPNRELVEALQGKVRELYVVGDCVESRRIIDAIWGGFRTARLT